MSTRYEAPVVSGVFDGTELPISPDKFPDTYNLDKLGFDTYKLNPSGEFPGTLVIFCEGADIRFIPDIPSLEPTSFSATGKQIINWFVISRSSGGNIVVGDLVFEGVPSDLYDAKLCTSNAMLPVTLRPTDAPGVVLVHIPDEMAWMENTIGPGMYQLTGLVPSANVMPEVSVVATANLTDTQTDGVNYWLRFGPFSVGDVEQFHFRITVGGEVIEDDVQITYTDDLQVVAVGPITYKMVLARIEEGNGADSAILEKVSP